VRHPCITVDQAETFLTGPLKTNQTCRKCVNWELISCIETDYRDCVGRRLIENRGAQIYYKIKSILSFFIKLLGSSKLTGLLSLVAAVGGRTNVRAASSHAAVAHHDLDSKHGSHSSCVFTTELFQYSIQRFKESYGVLANGP